MESVGSQHASHLLVHPQSRVQQRSLFRLQDLMSFDGGGGSRSDVLWTTVVVIVWPGEHCTYMLTGAIPTILIARVCFVAVHKRLRVGRLVTAQLIFSSWGIKINGARCYFDKLDVIGLTRKKHLLSYIFSSESWTITCVTGRRRSISGEL